MIKLRKYKEVIKDLLKVFSEEDVELSVHCVCERYLYANLTRREASYDYLLREYIELGITADGFDSVTPNFSLFRYRKCCYCEFIINTAYNKVEDERRREIIACFHQDNELQEAFLFNFEEDRLYRFTRQPDNSYIEEENSYSQRFKKDIRHFFGSSLEVLEELEEEKEPCIVDIEIPAKDREKEKRRNIENLKYLRKLIPKERCEQYAVRNNLDNIPITEDLHAWYSKIIYNKLKIGISEGNNLSTDLLYTDAAVYSDSTGTLRPDIAYFKSVDKPENGNYPTFKYALWVVEVVGEEGLENAQQKMEDILKKVVTIGEAFLYEPKTKKWTRYSRKKDNSFIIEEKTYSKFFKKYMGTIV